VDKLNPNDILISLSEKGRYMLQYSVKIKTNKNEAVIKLFINASKIPFRIQSRPNNFMATLVTCKFYWMGFKCYCRPI